MSLPIIFDAVQVDLGSASVLCGVTLQLQAGAPTVLIGPNGSGKTTLLRAAMGLLSPRAGRITWGGAADASDARLALVFQRPVMLRRSVAGNIRYALAAAGVPRARRDARVAALLEQVGLTALADRPAPQLSGGERQRLALARALAREPQVLFLDEPTASLDPAATLAIEELVRRVSGAGVKVVMTTHDLGEAARLAGEVVLLHRGRVIETGPASQLLVQPRTEEARRFIAGQLLV